MRIEHLFAGLAMAGYDSARGWYERLLGRPPDMLPEEGEAVWRLSIGASSSIVADEARAGRGLPVAVEDLREIRSDGVFGVTGRGPRLVVTDPDGNRITFFEGASGGN